MPLAAVAAKGMFRPLAACVVPAQLAVAIGPNIRDAIRVDMAEASQAEHILFA